MHHMVHAVRSACLQIKFIKGIDLSPNEVDEAKRRFQEMKVKRQRMNRGQDLQPCT